MVWWRTFALIKSVFAPVFHQQSIRSRRFQMTQWENLKSMTYIGKRDLLYQNHSFWVWQVNTIAVMLTHILRLQAMQDSRWARNAGKFIRIWTALSRLMKLNICITWTIFIERKALRIIGHLFTGLPIVKLDLARLARWISSIFAS